MPTEMTIAQELRLFLDYTPDQMRDLKQTGRDNLPKSHH